MTTDNLVSEYLAALAASDTDRVLALFVEGGMVHSPLYGTLAADTFYPVLFADTSEARLTLRSTMTGRSDGRDTVAFWFDFAWVLATGEPAPFTVVDVAELDERGLISALHIIYDTAPIRGAFERRGPSAEH